MTAVSRTGTSGPAPGDERGPIQRDGIAVPGLTIADVTRQLTWRVLGPLTQIRELDGGGAVSMT